MSDALGWFHEQSRGAPEALRARAGRYLTAQPPGLDAALVLASAAREALAATLARPGDRAVALDLLAADALVTLALKARAAGNPSGLAGFAALLSRAGAGTR